ncbi:hypothetical protein niasHS_009106 [Heterodera schachtii]|uniref:Uncharacterized protein n=2 Tax=Heterodera TaxID=34509 RepID=A0ABD2J3Q4_9BILA
MVSILDKGSQQTMATISIPLNQTDQIPIPMSIIPISVRPTNLTWMVVEGCVCHRPDAVCIRPVDYTKPVECLNVAHLGSFTDHLLSKPCDNTSNFNVTELVAGMSIKGTGCVNSMNFVFFLFIFMTQVFIFWAILLNVPSRLRRIGGLRPRRRPPVFDDVDIRPLRPLHLLVRERSSDHRLSAENDGNERRTGGDSTSTIRRNRLSTIQEKNENTVASG